MAGEDAAGKKRGGRPWVHPKGDGKRHKGALGAAATAKGARAVLVTCDKTKERQSVRDALNLLNEAADKHFPSAEKAEEEQEEQEEQGDKEEAAGGAKSVQELLQEEVAALKQDAKKRKTGRFTALDTGVKGVILVQIQDEQLSPVALLDKVFEEVEQTKEFPSRFINRLIPLERVGYSGVDEIREMARPIIEEHLAEYKKQFEGKDEVPPLEYAVEIKRRNCTGLKTMDVINALAELVGTEHKVNLTTPKSVILVEIFRNTCGVSVVTGFHRYKKFNVRSIIDPPVSTKPKEKEAGDKKSEAKEDTKDGEDESKDAAEAAADKDDED